MGQLRDLYEATWYALIRNDFDAAAQNVAPDCLFVVPGGTAKGFRRVLPYFQSFVQGYPDAQIEIRSSLDDGEQLAVRSTLTGTHSGVISTREGDILPSGQPSVFEFAEWLTVQDDKITEWFLYQDSTPLMQAVNSLRARAAGLDDIDQMACVAAQLPSQIA
jgi:predicted ester cyclase